MRQPVRTADGHLVLGRTLAAAMTFASMMQGLVCADDPTVSPARSLNLPSELAHYASPQRPKYFSAAGVHTFDTVPVENPVTDAGATLGRVLFYDTQLSANHSISCASCHVQQHAFSDPRPVSIGFQGQKTDRNAMSLNDMRFVRAGFFWDERAETLEEAVLQPLFSHVEMGLDRDMLVSRLTADAHYKSLFIQAFGSDVVAEDRVARALAQFLRSMESLQSKYDAAAADVSSATDDFPGFTASENLGKKIFFERCTACHHLGTESQVAIFAMFRSLNNGIDADGTARDGGRGDVTFNPSEVGSFKASSLRNVEYTAPYMHDGRLPTLEDVVEHYSSGVNRHPSLGPVSHFQFSAEEKAGLVDFLKTLSDPQFVNDPKFSDPWNTLGQKVESTTRLAESQPDKSPPPVNNIKSVEWDQSLDQGRGLDVAATFPWLMGLDADHDGQLNRGEANRIVMVLQKTGIAGQRSRTRTAAARIGRDAPGGPPSGAGSRGSERERRRSDPDEPTPPPEVLSVGDFDDNGTISPEEAEHYRALARFIEFAGGGRLEVFLDRLIARFDLDADQQTIARTHLKATRITMAKVIREQDLALCEELEKILGPDDYQAFQCRLVNRQTDAGAPAAGQQISREEAEKYVWNHDQDDDGLLSETEISELSRSLAAAPGGFGQVPPPATDIQLFATRILQFDNDGDGAISPNELPERMRVFAIEGDRDGNGLLDLNESQMQLQKSAFDRLVLTGIYIGGGFANTLLHSRDILDEIDLPDATRGSAKELLSSHDARIQELTACMLSQEFQRMQQLMRNKIRAEISVKTDNP